MSHGLRTASAPVPPMDSHVLLVLLLQVAFLLLLALALGQLAVRFAMPAIVGELCSGVLVGPSVLPHLLPDVSGWLLPQRPDQMHLLDGVAQLGVLLLVGITGTELDLDQVKRRGRTAVTVGVWGLVVPLVLGVAAGFTLRPWLLSEGGPEPVVFALFLGVAMCVTAIPVIAKTLMDMGLLHSDIGQLTLVAGLIDDMAAWFLLSVVSAMATSGLATSVVATSVLYPVGVVLFAIMIGRPVVGRVLRAADRSESPVPIIASAAGLILLGAAATQALNLGAVFGTFVCGILIGTGGTRIRERLAPLRITVLAFLAPVYFATAGLRMDLSVLARPATLGAACAVLVVAVAGKFAGAFIGAGQRGLNRWEALALGAGMNCRGVIEVIVAMTGLRLGVLDSVTYTMLVLVAIVTSLMAPPVLRIAMPRAETTAGQRHGPAERRAREAGDGGPQARSSPQ